MNVPLDHASGAATGGARVDLTERAISRALGEELRRTREACGWSRAQLVGMLPSGIGDRTLLSYEHGTRHLTVLRLIELCSALGVAADAVVAHALQRARIHLEGTSPWMLDRDRSCRDLRRCPRGHPPAAALTSRFSRAEVDLAL